MRREGYAFDQCFDRCQQPSSRVVDTACLDEVKVKLLTCRLKWAFHILHLAYIFASIESVLFNCAPSSLDIFVKLGGAARLGPPVDQSSPFSKSNKGSNQKEPLAKLSPTVAAFMYLENISKEKLNERFASLTVNRFARRGVAGRNNSLCSGSLPARAQ